MSLAPRQRGGTGARRVVHKTKRGVSAVLAGMVEGTDQIGQTMKSLSSWPNGKSPRAGGTNFSGLLADRADQIDLDAAAVD